MRAQSLCGGGGESRLAEIVSKTYQHPLNSKEMSKAIKPLRNIRPMLSASIAIAALALWGCATHRSVTKAEPTNFLRSTGTAQSGKIGRLPFERSWKNPALNAANYSHIVIRPVSTAYLRTGQWSQSASTFITSERTFADQAAQIARYWDNSLSRAFSSPQNRFARTGDVSQPGTLVVEIMLTEIVFGRPAANAASYAVSGGGVANSMLFSPSVAFEARVTDGATGQLLATASDRRSTKIKLVDINKFTFTKSNNEICDEWSQQIMQAFNSEMFPTVKRSWFSAF